MTNMLCIPVTDNTFPLAEKFIKPYEERCISLASYIRRKDPNIYFLTNKTISNKTKASVALSPKGDKATDAFVQPSKILGVIYLDRNLFHCIPDAEQLDSNALGNCLYNLITAKNLKIKCISGDAQGTQAIVKAVEGAVGEPFQTNHYNLMTVENVVSPLEELCNGDEIIRCTENDMDSLLPLQTKYMNEEVTTYGRKITDAEASLALRQILKNQLCLAISTDGEIVAKANTNAIGINWIQLGGIYTHPLYRRNGYAWQLISALCRRTSRAGKKTALFVKDINVPAMELYKKLGFTNSGLYEICYY